MHPLDNVSLLATLMKKCCDEMADDGIHVLLNSDNTLSPKASKDLLALARKVLPLGFGTLVDTLSEICADGEDVRNESNHELGKSDPLSNS